MAHTVNWNGYDFYVYDINLTVWNDVAGVYIFAGMNSDGRWYPVYIGQTNSFAVRLRYHDRLDAAKRRGARAIHARGVLNEPQRMALERHLISVFQPLLNV